MRFALSMLAISAVVGAFVLDWRAALLMMSAWWIDNGVKRLNERDAPNPCLDSSK